MKTLGEIIEAARTGERPDYDDLRYAICALDMLMTFDRMAFMRLADAEGRGRKPFLSTSAVWQWGEHFRRVKRALNEQPKGYIGWDNDPDNLEFVERRKKLVQFYDWIKS